MSLSAAVAAAAATTYGAAWPRAQLFGATICRTNSPRKLAITFDDGPNPAVTPQLLQLLDRYSARATFFLIGRHVRQCPHLAREIIQRGHVIGNHTENHPNLFWHATSAIREELRACQDAIAAATGESPKWFRPPYGFRNPMLAGVAGTMKLQVAMWTLLPGDWRGKPSSWLTRKMNPIAANAQRALKDANARQTGDILCLHDGGHKALNADRSATLNALEYWLPRWRDVGLEFVTIEEAVSAPAR